MEDALIIRQRAYDRITNHITDTLSTMLKDKDIKLEMVRTGVIINDTSELFNIICPNTNMTYGAFTVDRNTFTVTQANVYPIAFTEEFGVFHKKDSNTIKEYFKSFKGLCLEPYKKEDQYE